MSVEFNDLHEVQGNCLPDDTQRILPLIGNDEIKLCVDARGVMHDYTHAWGSHPPARITWSGRRHDRRLDRYNSNLFEWGFLNLQLIEEAALPPVTAWRQRLHPREGYVETEITRGNVLERTISFVHLEQNLIVFHREYTNLPPDLSRTLHAVYTLCQVGVEELPFRVTWTPDAPFAHGISADTIADGLRLYHGRVALSCDTACTAHCEGNRLELAVELPESNAITVFLSLVDDLGDNPQLLDIEHDGWMHAQVRWVNQENQTRLAAWQPVDYAAQTEALLHMVRVSGFAGLFAEHCAAWRTWRAQAQIELPAEETILSAALDTQLYTIRCSYTQWSLPANPFNTSWGAPYFWDERFPIEGLMHLGIFDMPWRAVEWRRAILPFSTMMTGGRGARYVPSAVESGAQIADRNGTQYYEFFTIGVIVNYLYDYCRFLEDESIWRRYYPVFREAAEFFRQWLLVELPGNNLMMVPLIDVDESHYPVQDGVFAICGAARILQVAAETAARLDIAEEELAEWQHLRALAWYLADHLCGRRGLLSATGSTTADNPVSVFIDYELDKISVPALVIDPAIRAWRDAYRQRSQPADQMKDGATNVTGETELLPFWSWGPLQAAHSAAMLCQPETAIAQLHLSLTTMMDFCALNESATTDLADVHHPWFTTAAGAFVRALTRMLVYPRGEEIFLLPGIPAGWRQFRFTLPVHHCGTVTVVVENGCLISVRLQEHHVEPITRVIHLPNRYLNKEAVFSPGITILEKTATDTSISLTVQGEVELLVRKS